MKRTSLISAALVALLVAAGTGLWISRHGRKEAPPVSKAPANHVLLAENAPQRAFLKVEAVADGPLPAAGPFNGRLVSADDLTARVFPAVNGRVLAALVNVGDKVAKGMVLAKLDSPDYASAVADLRKAEADAAAKGQAWQRAKALFADEALSRRELESTEADARSAEAELQRAKARLANLGGDGGDGHTWLLKSPVDGVVVDRQANPGTEVRSDGANPLFVVAALGELTLLVDLPEQEGQAARAGDKLTFRTDGDNGETFSATLERIAPALDPVTRRITARAKVDNRNGRFRPEMYVRVSLLAKDGGRSLRVPIGALLTQGLGSAVFVEAKPGDFELRTVKVLRQDHDFAYIAEGEGLHQGDKVVTKGALLLASELAGAE